MLLLEALEDPSEDPLEEPLDEPVGEAPDEEQVVFKIRPIETGEGKINRSG